VAFSMAWPPDAVQSSSVDEQACGVLAAFRGKVDRCFARRRDVLFEASDAVLYRPERVHMLAELSLEPECRRGHGALYETMVRWAMTITMTRRLARRRPAVQPG